MSPHTHSLPQNNQPLSDPQSERTEQEKPVRAMTPKGKHRGREGWGDLGRWHRDRRQTEGGRGGETWIGSIETEGKHRGR